jgi:hypothetical protein
VLFAPFGCLHPTALLAFCLSLTHHSHFKLLKTMKKLCSASGFTPSVFKGIYACVFLIFIKTFSFSQNSKWEFGVGLRPFQMENEPYNLILKYQLSNYFALRTGICFLYSQKNDSVIFREPRFAPPESFYYSYNRTDTKTVFVGSLGMQYGKKGKDFFWYGATDFIFRYRKDKPNSSWRTVGSTGNVNEPLGPYFDYIFNEDRILGYGIRQSFGIQYFINRYISVSIEAGAYYEKYDLLRLKTVNFTGIWYDKQQQLGMTIGEQAYEPQYLSLHDFTVSPLSMLSLFYHF